MHSGTEFEFAKIGIQPKLKVSQLGDEYEQEADRVAEQVMKMSASLKVTSQQLQNDDREEKVDRKCASCEMKEEEEDEKLKISRKSTNASSLETTARTANDINNIRSSNGTSLDTNTKEFMESRFGYDFFHVKIHTDQRASQSAKSIDALAYTVGKDVIFETGKYSPNTIDGRKILAHELTHVIQQSSERKTSSIISSIPPSIQRFTAYTTADQTSGKSLGWKHPGSEDLRVSDDGEMVVEDNG